MHKPLVAVVAVLLAPVAVVEVVALAVAPEAAMNPLLAENRSWIGSESAQYGLLP